MMNPQISQIEQISKWLLVIVGCAGRTTVNGVIDEVYFDLHGCGAPSAVQSLSECVPYTLKGKLC